MIKTISSKDVGRVATDECGTYLVEFVAIHTVSDTGYVSCVVKDLKNGGRILNDFSMIGGCCAMHWVNEPKMTLDVSTAVYTSRHVNQKRGVLDVMAYLTSETGECADWLVNPDRRKEDLLGECADVIICALDLALVYKKETSDLEDQELAEEVISHLNDLLKTKSKKWLDKHA